MNSMRQAFRAVMIQLHPFPFQEFHVHTMKEGKICSEARDREADEVSSSIQFL